MADISPLPDEFAARYRGWKEGGFAARRAHFETLAAEGQSPSMMVIACCDSRIQATEIFNAEAGDLFIHRNIANLVPPYRPDETAHGASTGAAVEYAVRALKVPHLLVLGHSNCGGIENGWRMHAEKSPPELAYVAAWLDLLRPACESAGDVGALGKQAIRQSLENLRGFPFVAEAVKSGALNLPGTWFDIATGALFALDPETGDFIPV